MSEGRTQGTKDKKHMHYQPYACSISMDTGVMSPAFPCGLNQGWYTSEEKDITCEKCLAWVKLPSEERGPVPPLPLMMQGLFGPGARNKSLEERRRV